MSTLADNIVHFARTLRRAGFPIGTGQIAESLRAVETVGIARRDDLRAALFATLVTNPGQRPLFDQAFEAFWRDPELFEKSLAALLPQVNADGTWYDTVDTNSTGVFVAPGVPLTPDIRNFDGDQESWNLGLRQSIFSWESWAALKRANAERAQAEADYLVAQRHRHARERAQT